VKTRLSIKEEAGDNPALASLLASREAVERNSKAYDEYMTRFKELTAKPYWAVQSEMQLLFEEIKRLPPDLELVKMCMPALDTAFQKLTDQKQNDSQLMVRLAVEVYKGKHDGTTPSSPEELREILGYVPSGW